MDYSFLADIFARTGALYPKTTYGAVFVIGGLIAMGFLWGVGQNYARQQQAINNASATEARLNQLASDIATIRTADRQTEEAKAVRNKILEYLATALSLGQKLQQGFITGEKEGPTQEAQKWLDEVREFIKAELGVVYLTRFESPSGVLPQEPTIPAGPFKQQNANVWWNIHFRLVRLQDFMAELSR